MKLEFKSENTTSTYYMIRKEESAFLIFILEFGNSNKFLYIIVINFK